MKEGCACILSHASPIVSPHSSVLSSQVTSTVTAVLLSSGIPGSRPLHPLVRHLKLHLMASPLLPPTRYSSCSCPSSIPCFPGASTSAVTRPPCPTSLNLPYHLSTLPSSLIPSPYPPPPAPSSHPSSPVPCLQAPALALLLAPPQTHPLSPTTPSITLTKRRRK